MSLEEKEAFAPSLKMVISIKGSEYLATRWKFSMLNSSLRDSDFVYELNSLISAPPQNEQVLLAEGTRFWHCGFRHRATISSNPQSAGSSNLGAMLISPKACYWRTRGFHSQLPEITAGITEKDPTISGEAFVL